MELVLEKEAISRARWEKRNHNKKTREREIKKREKNAPRGAGTYFFKSLFKGLVIR